ncbi:MAG TPA: hypothetical protein VNT24_01025, partial [Propionibacteriaceae bacterium]|nr:hypothetical protein [Propionibacteriaceae bacterium]
MTTTSPPPTRRPDTTAAVRPLDGGPRRDVGSVVFLGALWACLTVAALFLLFVLLTIIANGIGRLDLN